MGKNVINVVMLNYTDTLNDVTTLAHEMGHACHTQLVYQHQNALHADYGMLTAEVSSQFVEDYVYEQIATDLDDTQRLELLMQQLNDSVSSIHRQIACYRYEQAIHQEYRQTGFVSTEHLGELFTHHMSEYMGDAVSEDPGSEYRWVYRSHIRSFFYVFSYAGAMILAKMLQSKVAAGELTFSQIKE
jgi:oligoendopeptidase F